MVAAAAFSSAVADAASAAATTDVAATSACSLLQLFTLFGAN